MILQGLYSAHTICGVILILIVIYGTWLLIGKLVKSEGLIKTEENIMDMDYFHTIVEIAKQEIELFLAEKKVSIILASFWKYVKWHQGYGQWRSVGGPSVKDPNKILNHVLKTKILI